MYLLKRESATVMDNDEAVTHTTPSGALTLIGHSSRKIGVYENPQAILPKDFFFLSRAKARAALLSFRCASR